MTGPRNRETRHAELAQMCAAPSDGYSAGAWCEAANDLLILLDDERAARVRAEEALQEERTNQRLASRETRLGGGDDYRLRAVSEARERMHEAEDRADKAEQQVKELQEAQGEAVRYLESYCEATDPDPRNDDGEEISVRSAYVLSAMLALARSVEEQKS